MHYSADALKVAFRNAWKRWVPVTKKEKNDPNVAMNRFNAGDYFLVSSTPKFKIENGASIYTVGSCFARNVESALNNRGMDVLGFDFAVDEKFLHSKVGAMDNVVNRRSILNKYSTHSIYHEFERVLTGKKVKDSGFIEVTSGNWVDPQLAAVLKAQPFAELLEVRNQVDELIRSSLNADLIFITLGLTEVWFDHRTQSFLNSSPPASLMRNDRERFELKLPTYNDVYCQIEKTISLLSSKCKEGVKFIITVSPVPMGTTWSSDDVVIANTHSKSTLRVIAKELASCRDDVDYFPSYEMVTNSPRNLAWQSDQLHVKKEMVDFVIKQFVERYF